MLGETFHSRDASAILLQRIFHICKEGSEACGSICNLTLMNLDRVKQAVIKQQCQEYQRQGRDVNNTGQGSGQAATQSEYPGAISQGQAAENQQR